MHIKTPLYRSFKHSTAEREIYYKMEAHQPSGSFKLRGIGLLCSTLAAEGIKRFVIASGGNAGLAVAYSGNKLGIDTIVVVPESTRESMRERIMEMGAKLEVKGKVWNEAHEYACSLAEADDTYYVHPFDNPLLWEGHSTIVQELSEEIEEPDAIVLSVGGGGLFCGVMQGLENLGWKNCKVICAETEGAASMAKSIYAGHQITLDNITTIATSLGAKRIADRAWELAQNSAVIPYVCTDAEALQACHAFLNEYFVLTEPACGTALAALKSPALKDAKSIVFIVCGGSGMSLEDMLDYEIGFK